MPGTPAGPGLLWPVGSPEDDDTETSASFSDFSSATSHLPVNDLDSSPSRKESVCHIRCSRAAITLMMVFLLLLLKDFDAFKVVLEEDLQRHVVMTSEASVVSDLRLQFN